jgi:hypothetical protein
MTHAAALTANRPRDFCVDYAPVISYTFSVSLAAKENDPLIKTK